MKLTAPADLYLVAIGDVVKKGDDVDVPDDVAESLLEQGWKRPKPRPGKSNPKPKATAEASTEPDTEPANPEES